MKNLIILLLLFLLTKNTFAQKQHEIKADLISVFQKGTIGLSYEYGLRKRIGLEFDFIYEYNSQMLFNTSSMVNSQFPDSSYVFDFQYMHFTIGANYYVFPKANLDKLFVGFFWYNRIQIKEDEGFDELWLSYFGKEPSFTRTWRESNLRFKIGYKWLTRKCIVIEFETGIDYELRPYIDDGFLNDIDSFFTLNVGYRF